MTIEAPRKLQAPRGSRGLASPAWAAHLLVSRRTGAGAASNRRVGQARAARLDLNGLDPPAWRPTLSSIGRSGPTNRATDRDACCTSHRRTGRATLLSVRFGLAPQLDGYVLDLALVAAQPATVLLERMRALRTGLAPSTPWSTAKGPPADRRHAPHHWARVLNYDAVPRNRDSVRRPHRGTRRAHQPPYRHEGHLDGRVGHVGRAVRNAVPVGVLIDQIDAPGDGLPNPAT